MFSFPLMVRWRSGYAEVCKTSYSGSIPGRTSTWVKKSNAPKLRRRGITKLRWSVYWLHVFVFLEWAHSEVCAREGTRFVLRASAIIIKNNENFNFVIHLFQVKPFPSGGTVDRLKKALRKTPRGGGKQLWEDLRKIRNQHNVNFTLIGTL